MYNNSDNSDKPSPIVKATVVKPQVVMNEVAEEKEEDKTDDADCMKYNIDIDTNMKINLNKNIKELYNFVYDDDSAENNLDEYYKNKNITKLDSLNNICDEAVVHCDNKNEEKKYDSMCNDAINEHVKSHAMEVKNPSQDALKTNCVFINSYKNEKSMNGGKVFEDMELHGWDRQNDYSTL